MASSIDKHHHHHKPLFTSYWCGGCHPKDTMTILKHVPHYIDQIALAFAGLLPHKNSKMTTEFLCRYYSKHKIKKWVRHLQSRGQKIRMSIAESDQAMWNQIDPIKFVKSAKEKALDKWELDGFDIDVEGPSIDTLKVIIPLLRLEIGEKVPISFTCYTGSQEELDVIRSVKNDITWIQTMAYFESTKEMKELAKTYAKIVGKARVIIGVKNATTPIEEVIKLCRWVRREGFKGIMLWSTERDNPNFGNQRIWEWSETIHKALHRKEGANGISEKDI